MTHLDPVDTDPRYPRGGDGGMVFNYLEGECPSCHRGENSLVYLDYIPLKSGKLRLYLKCIACNVNLKITMDG